MRTEHRRGFIGFLLTMALGIALGTAALVVSKEIIKGKGEPQTPAFSQTRFIDRAQALKVAWKNYDQARLAYESAVKSKSENVASKREAVFKAKTRLEKAILSATPGVPSLPDVPATAPTAANATPPTTSNAPAATTTSGNPYEAGDRIVQPASNPPSN